MSEVPPFVSSLGSIAEPTDEPLELDPEATAELHRMQDSINECLARAAASAQNYVVWR